MPSNPRMYRKNHPFKSKYSSKNNPQEPTAAELRSKLGANFITPISDPSPVVFHKKRSSARQVGIQNSRKKAASLIQQRWRESRPVHPPCWNRFIHYGQCGQSCPCCRKRAGEILGACTVCK